MIFLVEERCEARWFSVHDFEIETHVKEIQGLLRINM